MSPTLEPIHHLAQGVRRYGPALLAGMPNPHDELMSLVWGPRFDREHALGLVAQRPAEAAQTLPALLAAADRFDALQVSAQRRLRRMIVRHRALRAAGGTCDVVSQPAVPDDGKIVHAPHSAH
jgi:hypothetical protein